MKSVDILVFGFGGVGRSVLRLLAENDGYSREGVRLRAHSVFDRGGGVLGAGHDTASIIDAKIRGGSVTALEGGQSVEIDQALRSLSNGVLVDCSITDAETGEPGLTPARKALELGISVVFASKGPLVARYSELSELARARGARLGASAALGIPLPTLEVGSVGLRGGDLRRFRGVFSDTANQILRDLESGLTLEEAVERARAEGTIEADPRLDLEGWDAAYKLLLLARAIWEPTLTLETVKRSGVETIGGGELQQARSRGRRLRLVATGSRDDRGTIRLKTEAESLSADDPLYELGPGEKGCVFETGTMGTITVKSSKGGPLTTAACVIKDVLNIAAPRLF